MMAMSELSYAPAHRQGEVSPASIVRTARDYLDLLIDGTSLREMLATQARANGDAFLADPDLITPFGWGPPWAQLEAAECLLLRLPPDLPTGRRSILVCPECGDAGCGVVSVVVEQDGDAVVWRDFGHEYDNDEQLVNLHAFRGVGPFRFARAAYESTLDALGRGGNLDTK